MKNIKSYFTCLEFISSRSTINVYLVYCESYYCDDVTCYTLILQMYEYILEKIREVVWIFGNVTCAGYPLKDIDTISETGEINRNSVLNLVVYGVGHLPKSRVLSAPLFTIPRQIQHSKKSGMMLALSSYQNALFVKQFVRQCMIYSCAFNRNSSLSIQVPVFFLILNLSSVMRREVDQKPET